MDQNAVEKMIEYSHIVVGAGAAGAYAAGRLKAAGANPVIVDKARGTGGRLSSKRLVVGDASLSYDLGAQQFEVTHSDFRTYLETRDDIRWSDDTHAYVSPRNSSYARGAMNGASSLFGNRVESAEFDGQNWTLSLTAKDGETKISAPNLVLATPPKQGADILGDAHQAASALSGIEHEAQWVLMLLVEHVRGIKSDLVTLLAERERFLATSQLSPILEMAYLDSAKEGRLELDERSVLVLHATPAWTKQNLDLEKEAVKDALISALNHHLPESSPKLEECILDSHVHRWLYSRPDKTSSIDAPYVADVDQHLYICGDYFSVDSEYGVESAFLSAHQLVEDVLLQNP